MKIKTVPTIISASVSALIAYGLYYWCKAEDLQLLISIGGFLTLFITLTACIGLGFEGRTNVNTAAVGGVFFVLLLISNLIFAFVQFNPPIYVILNGLLLLVMILVIHAIVKANQQ